MPNPLAVPPLARAAPECGWIELTVRTDPDRLCRVWVQRQEIAGVNPINSLVTMASRNWYVVTNLDAVMAQLGY